MSEVWGTIGTWKAKNQEVINVLILSFIDEHHQEEVKKKITFFTSSRTITGTSVWIIRA
jgi:hypothetical protein